MSTDSRTSELSAVLLRRQRGVAPARCRDDQYDGAMGYDLRTTRALDWDANKGFEISIQERLDLVAADPDLTPDLTNGPYAVRFGGTRWLDWSEGNVFATDPDHAAVTKLLAIAQRLAAAVLGDDGEFCESAREWSRARKRG